MKRVLRTGLHVHLNTRFYILKVNVCTVLSLSLDYSYLYSLHSLHCALVHDLACDMPFFML
jgi:hypothetical protein